MLFRNISSEVFPVLLSSETCSRLLPYAVLLWKLVPYTDRRSSVRPLSVGDVLFLSDYAVRVFISAFIE